VDRRERIRLRENMWVTLFLQKGKKDRGREEYCEKIQFSPLKRFPAEVDHCWADNKTVVGETLVGEKGKGREVTQVKES